MSKKFYITTAIAYVNSKPHIGFAMETVQADCVARYHRMCGDDVWFLTGTDEHGMKIAQTAEENGMTPQELADMNAGKVQELKDLLNLSFDDFIRTTQERHKRGAQKLWQKLVDAGDIYKSTYEGLYCVGCEAYITEKELVDGQCPNHKKAPEKISEDNYFFKLSKYSEKIGELIRNDQLKVIPESRKHEILNVIDGGLHDVSFSRPKDILSWGIEVPNDPEQTMYVWCDALSNYITALGYADDSERCQKFWPADVHLIGKDIIRFHAAIWIGMLLSAGEQLPKAIYAHGFITSEGHKMSKSLGNVVDPVETVEKYGTDPVRYYLLREIPTTDDGDFSKERFEIIYRSELANNLGNLTFRVLTMTEKYFAGAVPEADSATVDQENQERVQKLWDDYQQKMDAFDLKAAIEVVSGFIDEANKLIEDKKPWVLAKENATELAEVMYVLLEMLRHIGMLISPFIPEAAAKIMTQLNVDYLNSQVNSQDFEVLKKWGGLTPGTSTTKGKPLFPRLEE